MASLPPVASHRAMDAMARNPLGSQIVSHLSGSVHAKRRLKAILQTLSGQLSIPEACRELGIGESRFHAVRNEVLQRALEGLEPRPRGRPPAPRPDPRIRQLQQQVQSLNLDLRASQIREELAIAMPHLARPPQTPEGGGKKSGRRNRRGRS